MWFVGLDLNKQLKKNIDLTSELQSFTNTGMCVTSCIRGRAYLNFYKFKKQYAPFLNKFSYRGMF